MPKREGDRKSASDCSWLVKDLQLVEEWTEESSTSMKSLSAAEERTRTR